MHSGYGGINLLAKRVSYSLDSLDGMCVQIKLPKHYDNLFRFKRKTSKSGPLQSHFMKRTQPKAGVK